MIRTPYFLLFNELKGFKEIRYFDGICFEAWPEDGDKSVQTRQLSFGIVAGIVTCELILDILFDSVEDKIIGRME